MKYIIITIIAILSLAFLFGCADGDALNKNIMQDEQISNAAENEAAAVSEYTIVDNERLSLKKVMFGNVDSLVYYTKLEDLENQAMNSDESARRIIIKIMVDGSYEQISESINYDNNTVEEKYTLTKATITDLFYCGVDMKSITKSGEIWLREECFIDDDVFYYREDCVPAIEGIEYIIFGYCYEYEGKTCVMYSDNNIFPCTDYEYFKDIMKTYNIEWPFRMSEDDMNTMHTEVMAKYNS